MNKLLSFLSVFLLFTLTGCAQFTTLPPQHRPRDFEWTNLKPRRAPDREAREFIQRAGLSSDTERKAVVELVRDFKKAGVWKKLTACYPFVGDNASACAQNLLSAAHPIQWNGSVTFNNGVIGDGVTGYGLLDLTPGSSYGGNGPDHFTFAAFPSGPGGDVNQTVLGAISDEVNVFLRFRGRQMANNGIATVKLFANATTPAVEWSQPASPALVYLDSDIAKNQTTVIYGNTTVATGPYSTAFATDIPYTILALNHRAPNQTATERLYYYSGRIWFVALGAPLSAQEHPQFTAAVNKFLTALNRTGAL